MLFHPDLEISLDSVETYITAVHDRIRLEVNASIKRNRLMEDEELVAMCLSVVPVAEAVMGAGAEAVLPIEERMLGAFRFAELLFTAVGASSTDPRTRARVHFLAQVLARTSQEVGVTAAGQNQGQFIVANLMPMLQDINRLAEHFLQEETRINQAAHPSGVVLAFGGGGGGGRSEVKDHAPD